MNGKIKDVKTSFIQKFYSILISPSIVIKSKFYFFPQLKTKNETPATKIKVKISGDGTRMLHTSNLFVCSFAILENSQNIRS